MIGGLAVAVFTWLFDFLVHGHLLMGMYQATASMWRPIADMPQFFPFCIIYHLALGYLVTKGFFAWRKYITVGAIGSCNCPYRKGMGFGMWVGMILGISHAMTYVYLPIPGMLAIYWLLADIAKWALAGILLAKLYAWKEKASA